ncbi:RnfABCDGE type electron transport complex subunit G [Peptostreptococcus faecalis]|uniref:RnfABCDGE type electron transport complex subunit G n=1 Tax=Peptostreptococcus faecalis TaxID=2045015 RepID=UPI000C7E38B3|nr:RnfABCDGE type electron transport complex subunit G [Peptostreptococcus faecalis]
MNSIVKMGGTLFAFSAVAALLLAGTNEITKPIIEQRDLQANNEARTQVLPGSKDFKEIDKSEYSSANAPTVKEVFQGIDGSNEIGYTIKTSPKGYGGDIELTIGISKDGKIMGVNVGNNTETPGLGAKAADPAFKDQYKGKEVSTPIEVEKSGVASGNKVKAISGATITSNAVTDGVNEAIEIYNAVNK